MFLSTSPTCFTSRAPVTRSILLPSFLIGLGIRFWSPFHFVSSNVVGFTFLGRWVIWVTWSRRSFSGTLTCFLPSLSSISLTESRRSARLNALGYAWLCYFFSFFHNSLTTEYLYLLIVLFIWVLPELPPRAKRKGWQRRESQNLARASRGADFTCRWSVFLLIYFSNYFSFKIHVFVLFQIWKYIPMACSVKQKLPQLPNLSLQLAFSF